VYIPTGLSVLGVSWDQNFLRWGQRAAGVSRRICCAISRCLCRGPGEVDGEGLAIVWVLDAESADGVLDEGDVFFGAEEDLNGLPADEAFFCEGRD